MYTKFIVSYKYVYKACVEKSPLRYQFTSTPMYRCISCYLGSMSLPFLQYCFINLIDMSFCDFFKINGRTVSSKYSGIIQATSLIIKEEGITALW